MSGPFRSPTWMSNGLRRGPAGIFGGVSLLAGLVVIGIALWPRLAWTPQELTALRSLSLSSLGPVSPDPSSAVADDLRAAALGQALFFDTRSAPMVRSRAQHAISRAAIAPAAPSGHSEVKPLGLSETELRQLEAFLRALSGPLVVSPDPLAAPTDQSSP